MFAPEDPREPVERLLTELQTRLEGLSSREVERRLVAYGPNELSRRGGRRWPQQLATQFTHPLALLLWLAAALAFVGGSPVLGAAIVAVIVLNAVFAFAQERQAERAIEALRRYLPPHALVLRDGHRQQVEAEHSCRETSSCWPRGIASRPTRACSKGRSTSTSRR